MIERINAYIYDHGGIGPAIFAMSRHAVSSDFSKKVMETLATRVLGIVLGFAMSIIIARILGPEGRGLYAMAALVTATGVQFSNLGLPQASSYFVARDNNVLSPVVGNSILVTVTIGTAVSVAALAAFSFLPGIAPIDGVLLYIAIACIPIGQMTMIYQNILMALMDVRAYNIADLMGKVITVVAIAVFIFAGWKTAETLYAISLAVLVMILAWESLQIRKHLTGSISVSLPLLRDQMKYAYKPYVTGFLAFMVMRMDLIMLNHYLGESTAGIYSIAIAMCNLLFTMPIVVGTILFPRLCAPDTFSKRWKSTMKAVLVIGAVMFAACMISLFAGRFAIRVLYGEVYTPAFTPFCIMLAGVFVWSLESTLRRLVNSDPVKGFNINFVFAWTLTLLANIALNVLLIPEYGMNGAAIATSVSLCVAGIATSILTRQYYIQGVADTQKT